MAAPNPSSSPVDDPAVSGFVALMTISGIIQTAASGARVVIDSTGIRCYAANGTTIRALSSNGTTTGGTIGDRYKVTCISATQWAIDGQVVATGTAATPFATS